MCDSWGGGSGQGCYHPTGHTTSQKISLGHKDTEDGLLKISVRARGDLKGRKWSIVSPVQISSWLRLEFLSFRKLPRGWRNQVCPWPALQSTPGTVWTWSEYMHFLRRFSVPLPSAPTDFPQSWKVSNGFVSSSPCSSHRGFVYLHLLH